MNTTNIYKQICSLEEKIEQKSLLLKDLRQISEDAMHWMGETCGSLHHSAEHLFLAAQKAEQELIDQDLTLLEKGALLRAKAQQLWLTKDRMNPEEAAEAIVELTHQFDALKKGNPSTLVAQKEFNELEATIEDLQFEFVYPIVAELRPEGASFAANLMAALEALDQEGPARCLERFNEAQREEIGRYLGSIASGVSAEGLSHALESYLTSLHQQVLIARFSFLGATEEAAELLNQLPEEIRTEVDQLVSQEAEALERHAEEFQQETLMASALLRSLERRLGL